MRIGSSLLALLLLALQTTASRPVVSQDGGWVLVRGESERVGSFTYERIARVYLGSDSVEVVRPATAGGDRSTSRFVIGTPDGNALVTPLFTALGITVGEDYIAYAGRKCITGMGLVVFTEDPDGEGSLFLMTGIDESGVLACLEAPLSIEETGWVMISDRRVMYSGSIPLQFDTSEPAVVRLDREAEYLLDETMSVRGDERILRIQRGLRGYEDVHAQAGWTDLVGYGRWLVRSRAEIEETREHFYARDIERQILDVHARCAEVLGEREGPQPVYFVMHGRPDGTNARTFDADPVTGRRRVLLNLDALRYRRHFDAALIHETVHTLQGSVGPSLLERAMFEGVPTYLTQVVDATISDYDALLWSPEELRAAREHHDAILAAIRELGSSTDRAVHTPYVILHSQPARIPGAPSRTAYYIAWLAAKAWHEAHPDRSPADLLMLDAAEIFAALD